MAFTSDQLTALDSAIAQGALSVQFADRRVTYHSLAEMMRLRDLMRSELGLSQPAASKSRFVYPIAGKRL